MSNSTLARATHRGTSIFYHITHKLESCYFQAGKLENFYKYFYELEKLE